MAEKTITISGKEVNFKITGATPIMYLAMWGTDFLKDFMAMEKAQSQGDAPDLLTFYKVSYCLAKKADDSIPQMEDWLDSFEDGFPVADVMTELMPLIQANFSSNIKKSPVRNKK